MPYPASAANPKLPTTNAAISHPLVDKSQSSSFIKSLFLVPKASSSKNKIDLTA